MGFDLPIPAAQITPQQVRLGLVFDLDDGVTYGTSRRTQLDLDTVASELELSGAELQLGDTPASASCQTLLDGQTASKTEFKPKGILKNSKTSENFR